MPRLHALFALTLAACASTEATLEGFDVSCDAPQDCMAVLLGDVCSCDCTWGAINIAESDAWADQDADLRAGCGEDTPECAPCPDATLSCDANVCQATMIEE